MSPEECKLYSDNTKYELVNMSVNGMMCTGCEHKVEAGLSGVKGVAKVAKVDYKTGTALVVMEKGACCTQSLTTAVANQGFEAKVIPAVATMETPAKMTGAKSGCAASCTGKVKATNASAKKAEDTK
jgi:copper chaperone CopZ